MVPASSDGTRGLLISSVMSLNPMAGPFHSEMASDHLDLSGWISVASVLETIAVVMVVFFFFFNCSEGVIFLPGTSPHPTPELLLQMCPVLNLRAFLAAVCSSSTMSRMRCLRVRALRHCCFLSHWSSEIWAWSLLRDFLSGDFLCKQKQLIKIPTTATTKHKHPL